MTKGYLNEAELAALDLAEIVRSHNTRARWFPGGTHGFLSIGQAAGGDEYREAFQLQGRIIMRHDGPVVSGVIPDWILDQAWRCWSERHPQAAADRADREAVKADGMGLQSVGDEWREQAEYWRGRALNRTDAALEGKA